MHGVARALLVVTLALALSLAGISPLSSASSAAIIILHVDSTRMDVDGTVVMLDAAPIIIEGRTLLPIRPVVDVLEGQISWDATEHKVTIVKGSTSIEMWIDSPTAFLNGVRTQIDPSNAHVTPLIVKSRTMLPLRFVASALGGQVAWEPTERKMTMTFPVAPPQQPPEQPLTVPELRTPAQGVTLDASMATFSWAPAQDGATYTLRIDDSTGAKVYEASSLSGTIHTIPDGTLGNGGYSWQVTAFSRSGKSSTSSTLSFSVRRRLTTQEIAKMRRAVAYIEVSGYKNGKAFSASGSGFFISSDGLLVTNYHVIDGALTGTVKLDKDPNVNGGQMLPIDTVVGYDEELDLAILRIRGSGLPTCSLGDSDGVVVGDDVVVAIGSQGGEDWWQNTVSEGIVSGIRAAGIQTTTRVTAGTSGGALFDAYGDVVGVTSAASLTSGGQLVNDVPLSVPINRLKGVARSSAWTLVQVYERERGTAPALPAPRIVAPADESEAGVPGLTLTWAAVAGADRYDVWIGTGRAWGDSRVVFSKENTTVSLDLPIQLLAAGTSYSWSVRAHNYYGWGSWSDLSHFTTVEVPLTAAPSLITPKNMDGLRAGQSTLSFTWSSVPGATSYHFFLGRPNPGGAASVVVEQDVSGTAYSVSGSLLAAGEVYTWSVAASAEDQGDQKSPAASFSMYTYGSPSLRPKDACGQASTACWVGVSTATAYIIKIYKGSSINPGKEYLTKEIGVENLTYLAEGWFDKGSYYCGYVAAMRGEYLIGVSTTFTFYK